jgi:hypothetical protein
MRRNFGLVVALNVPNSDETADAWPCLCKLAEELRKRLVRCLAPLSLQSRQSCETLGILSIGGDMSRTRRIAPVCEDESKHLP